MYPMKDPRNLSEVSCTVGELQSKDVPIISGQEAYFHRAESFPLSLDTFNILNPTGKILGCYEEFH